MTSATSVTGRPCVGQQLGGAAGGNQPDAQRMQRLCEFDDAGLVGDGNECVHGLQELVFDEFLAQRVAVQAQPLGGLGLVVVGLGHHHFEQRLFDHLDQHLVHAIGFGAAQVPEVAFQAGAHAFFDVFLAHARLLPHSSRLLPPRPSVPALRPACDPSRRRVRRRIRPPRAAARRSPRWRSCGPRKASPPGSALHVPADVLARAAHAGELAVERVVVLQMIEQQPPAPRPPAAAPDACRWPGNARSRGRSRAGPARRGRS